MKFGELGGNDQKKSEFKVGRDPNSNPDWRSVPGDPDQCSS